MSNAASRMDRFNAARHGYADCSTCGAFAIAKNADGTLRKHKDYRGIRGMHTPVPWCSGKIA